MSTHPSVSGLASSFCTLAPDGLRQLGLGHLRAALDVLLPGLVVELILCPALRPAVRAQAATPARRDVVRRRPARLLGLAGPSAFLVDGPRRDLLSGALTPAPLLQPGLDVLVLPLTLRTRSSRHVVAPFTQPARYPTPSRPFTKDSALYWSAAGWAKDW